MPDVRMPDGTVIKNVPEGTTKEQLQARYRASKQAKPRTKGTGIGILDNVLGAFNEAVTGGVQGLENIGRVFTDPIVGAIYGKDALQADRKRAQSRYEKVSRATATRPQPVARTVGQIGASVPFAAVKAPAALGRAAPVATRAVQGAFGGAAVRDTDKSPTESMGIGAAANVILPPVIGKVAGSKPVRALVSRAGKALSPVTGALDDVADKGRKALGFRQPPRLPGSTATLPAPAPTLAPLGRQAQARAARLMASGVQNPTTGMVTRNPRAWTAERELAKVPGVGDDIQQALVDTNRQIGSRANDITGRLGGPIGPEAAGQRVSGALEAKNSQLQDEIGSLYTSIRKTAGDVRVPAMDNFKAAQAHPDWADNTQFDDMVAAVNKRLMRYADADGGAAGLTVKQSEELRKFIGGLGPNSSQTFAMRRVLQDGLDADVIDNIGGSPFAAARAAANARFNEFKGTFAGRIADEAIPPEKLTGRVLNAPLKDVRALKRSLTTGTPQQQAAGQEALGALRAQAVDDLFSKSISSDGDNVAINGKALLDNFNKRAPVLRELLDPAEYKDIRRLALSARDVASPPANSYVNYSNTASAAANRAEGLFPTIPPPKSLGPIGKAAVRGAGTAVGGALGSLGGPAIGYPSAAGGYAAAQSVEKALLARAQAAYQQRLAQQAAMAADPYAAAANLAAPNADEVTRLMIERWKNLAGNSPVIGGLSAAPKKRRAGR